MKRLYGGLDIHKEKIAGCILNESGDVIREQCFPVSKKAIEKFVDGISNAEISFAIEACGLWRAVPSSPMAQYGIIPAFAGHAKASGFSSSCFHRAL